MVLQVLRNRIRQALQDLRRKLLLASPPAVRLQSLLGRPHLRLTELFVFSDPLPLAALDGLCSFRALALIRIFCLLDVTPVRFLLNKRLLVTVLITVGSLFLRVRRRLALSALLRLF